MRDNILPLIIAIIIVAIILLFILPFVLVILSALGKYLWNASMELWQVVFQMW